jgi:ribonuclease HI
MRSDYTFPAYHYSKTFKGIIDRDYWRNKDPVFPEDALIWFTDGSRADSGTGPGICGLRPNSSLSFPLGKFATVFQTEIYAILQCACEYIRRAYKRKRILIFSDSQVALKALSSPKVISRLVAECLNALSELAHLTEVILVWVLGHRGILGNEEADKLARQASAMPLLGPEPALGIPKCSAREAIKNWIQYQHYSTWRDLPGHRHGKLFIGKPCKKRVDDLLQLSRHLLKTAVATFMVIMGPFDGDSTCRFCRKETETMHHII